VTTSNRLEEDDEKERRKITLKYKTSSHYLLVIVCDKDMPAQHEDDNADLRKQAIYTTKYFPSVGTELLEW
jgi:hypothetical protein